MQVKRRAMGPWATWWSLPCLAAIQCFALNAEPSELSSLFEQQVKRGLEVGVDVRKLSTGAPVFEFQGDKALSAASTVKLVTAWSALKRLGPWFTTQTEVRAVGGIPADGKIRGDLILVGGGDPSLVTERLYLLTSDLKRLGLKEVTGKVVADETFFDSDWVDSARLDSGEEDRAYNAPVNALSFNYNTSTLLFRPGTKAGAMGKVDVAPDTGYLQLHNQTVTAGRGQGYSARIERKEEGAGDRVIVKGIFPLGMKEQHRHLSITRPALQAAHAFCTQLMELGVKLNCRNVVLGKSPPDAQKIATLESLPLRDQVALMNKYSNNFIAESLVKQLAAQQGKGPGTAAAGLALIKEDLVGLGEKPDQFQMVSGSGLTRENRISARLLTRVLVAAFRDLKIFPELLSSLPIAGQDGTLKSRLKDSGVSGVLRAKTGSIDDVVSVAGVMPNKNGDLLAYAVVVNGKRADRAWEEPMVNALMSLGR